MATVLCMLYDDPMQGHPCTYARDGLPKVELYPDGRTLPSPLRIDFKPGDLLRNVSGGLGLHKFLAAQGHTLIATSDDSGPNSVFDRALPDADIVISQACWPAYLSAKRLANARKLRLVITAGVGSDHIDLEAAASRGITVAEITWSTSISAAEYTIMLILSLLHHTVPLIGHGATEKLTLSDRGRNAYDLEGMHVGCIGAGHTGLAVLRRLRPFDARLHYTDPRRLPLAIENEFGLTWHASAASMVQACDVVTIHCPLHNGTNKLFDGDMIGRMKRGAWLVNTSRSGICDPGAIRDALRTGQLAGYASDTGYLPSRQGDLHSLLDARCPRRRATPPGRAKFWNAGTAECRYVAITSCSIGGS